MSETNLMINPRRSPAELFTWAGMWIAVPSMIVLFAYLDWIWAYLLGINLATLGLFSYDKFGARHNLLRVPENTLHYFVFFGGTPAAYFAQRWLHHKTHKESFQRQFWLIVAIQIPLIILIWFFGT